MTHRVRLFIASMALILTAADTRAQHNPVSIQRADGTVLGSGFLVRGPSSCLVITAGHVTKDDLTFKILDTDSVISDSAFIQWTGTRPTGTPEIDLSILAYGKRAEDCSSSSLPSVDRMKAALKASEGYIVSRLSSGAQKRARVRIASLTDDFLLLSTVDPDTVTAGLSGSLVAVGGDVVGVVLGNENSVIRAARLDFAASKNRLLAVTLGLYSVTPNSKPESGKLPDLMSLDQIFSFTLRSSGRKSDGAPPVEERKLSLPLRIIFEWIQPLLAKTPYDDKVQEHIADELASLYAIDVKYSSNVLKESDFLAAVSKLEELNLVSRKYAKSTSNDYHYWWYATDIGKRVWSILDEGRGADGKLLEKQITLLSNENLRLKRENLDLQSALAKQKSTVEALPNEKSRASREVSVKEGSSVELDPSGALLGVSNVSSGSAQGYIAGQQYYLELANSKAFVLGDRKCTLSFLGREGYQARFRVMCNP